MRGIDCMNIALISNFPIEEICIKEGLKCNYKEGWVKGYLSSVANENKIIYCFPCKMKTEVKGVLGENIIYKSYYRKENDWRYTKKIQKEIFKLVSSLNGVDIIHIMGTEYGSTYAFLKAAGELKILDKCVVSLQGIIWTYAYHYNGGIDSIFCNLWTLGDIYFRENIAKGKRNFYIRGEMEKNAILLCKNVIGRTEYDFASTKIINSNINYYKCGEILRDTFYENEWNYENCCKNRIFVSQGNYPIKGFHFLVKALSIVIKRKPTVQVYVTGRDVVKSKIMTSYQKYLKKLIVQLKCENNIHFLGKLNEKQMVEQYLKANIYVNPSVIENSSNSIGEAMILGVPIIASDVGGTKDILKDKEEGILYQYDAYYMLAYYIDVLLNDKEMVLKLSENAKKRGKSNHDKRNCYETLLNVYIDVSKKYKGNM